MTLWDNNGLQKDTRETPQPFSDFEIIASESIEDKSSSLNVKASLKASFLGGLVEVGGSAKYLNDQKTSKYQARVTLTYKTTTKFQELSMNHLGRGNVKHREVFDKGMATHVVTGILYGAQAFFIFDRDMSETEDHQDIQGSMKMMIKKIPCLSLEGEGSLKMEDKANVEKFSCKFYGDFSLKKNPVSFQDAVEVYQSLPTLLGASGENAVPMKVWLLPLTVIDSCAAKLVREISVSLVQKAQNVLEDFSDLEMRYNDLMQTTTAQRFPQISKTIKSFKEICSEFKLKFQKTLAEKLPSIRGGGEEEAELAEILRKRHSSPFNSKDLHKWMDCKEREIYILLSFTNMMKNTQIIPSLNHLYKESVDVEHTLCFVFTSLGNTEPYLSTLSSYLRGTTKQDDPQDPHNWDVETEQWYTSKIIAGEVRKKAKLFSDFAEANKENENTKFLVMGRTNMTQKGSAIFLYERGIPVSENFEPPSRPETVTVGDINHSSLSLKISTPRYGAENITSYLVEFCVCGKDEWQKQTVPKAEEVAVNYLRPNTEFKFRCRAVTSAGVGPANEMSRVIKTLPCSPPGKPEVEIYSSQMTVSWPKPAEIGQDVQILNYVVEYAKPGLQWTQTMSKVMTATITGLQAETEYAVRVRCDCGEAGISKESIAVLICTTKTDRLATVLKHTSKKISLNLSWPSIYHVPLREEDMNTDRCRMYTFGTENKRQNRTIILLGTTESGKSTLINAMINYIVGVEWRDDFRFKLVNEAQRKSQVHRQTFEVNVYKLYHQEGFKVPFSLTIVDTPGFGDTRGIDRDMEITEQLRSFLSDEFGVSEIDFLCIVFQAFLRQRFIPTLGSVFDSVMSIFCKDVVENIRLLVTFADANFQHPPVLKQIKAFKVPCPKTDVGLPIHFKFNHLALFADNTDSDRCRFWSMSVQSMESFFDALNVIDTKRMTKVLRKQHTTNTQTQTTARGFS